MTKDEWEEEIKADAMNERAIEEAEARMDYKLEDDYDFFAAHFSDEFERAIEAISELRKLHDRYNHTLEAEDLI